MLWQPNLSNTLPGLEDKAELSAYAGRLAPFPGRWGLWFLVGAGQGSRYDKKKGLSPVTSVASGDCG